MNGAIFVWSIRGAKEKIKEMNLYLKCVKNEIE
jgi:hypothetical protein